MPTLPTNEEWRARLDLQLCVHVHSHLASNSSKHIIDETQNVMSRHLSTVAEGSILPQHSLIKGDPRKDNDLSVVLVGWKWNASSRIAEYLRNVRPLDTAGDKRSSFWEPESVFDTSTIRLETPIRKRQTLNRTPCSSHDPTRHITLEFRDSADKDLLFKPAPQLASGDDQLGFGGEADALDQFQLPILSSRSGMAETLKDMMAFGFIRREFHNFESMTDCLEFDVRLPCPELAFSNISSPLSPRARAIPPDDDFPVIPMKPSAICYDDISDRATETQKLVDSWTFCSSSPSLFSVSSGMSNIDTTPESVNSPLPSSPAAFGNDLDGDLSFTMDKIIMPRHRKPPEVQGVGLSTDGRDKNRLLLPLSIITLATKGQQSAQASQLEVDRMLQSMTFKSHYVASLDGASMATLSDRVDGVPCPEDSQLTRSPQGADGESTHKLRGLGALFKSFDDECHSSVLPWAAGIMNLGLMLTWRPFDYNGNTLSHESVCSIATIPAEAEKSFPVMEYHTKVKVPRRGTADLQREGPAPDLGECTNITTGELPSWSSELNMLSRNEKGFAAADWVTRATETTNVPECHKGRTTGPFLRLEPSYTDFVSPEPGVTALRLPAAFERADFEDTGLSLPNCLHSVSMPGKNYMPITSQCDHLPYSKSLAIESGSQTQYFSPTSDHQPQEDWCSSPDPGIKGPYRMPEFSESDNRPLLHRFLLYRGICADSLRSIPLNVGKEDVVEALSSHPVDYSESDLNTTLDMGTNTALVRWNSLNPRKLWATPETTHHYLASLSVIERRALVKYLECRCGVVLTEVGDPEIQGLIIDSHSMVQILSFPEIVPSKIDDIASTIADLGYRFSRILVILEGFPHSQARHSVEGDKGNSADLRKPVPSSMDSVTALKRKIAIRLRLLGVSGLAEDSHRSEVWWPVAIDYVTSQSVENTAQYIRLFGDEVERSASLDEQMTVWGDRAWLRETMLADDVYSLGLYRGMNPFVALAIASVMPLAEFLHMNLSEKQRRFGSLVGHKQMELFEAQRLREVLNRGTPTERVSGSRASAGLKVG